MKNERPSLAGTPTRSRRALIRTAALVVAFLGVAFAEAGLPAQAPYRPDLHLGARRDSQIGDGIYEGFWSQRGVFLAQKVLQPTKPGRSAKFHLTVENDGEKFDSLLLRSPQMRGNMKVQIQQLTPSRGNVTAAIARRRFILINRVPGARAKFCVRVVPRRSRPKLKSMVLTAISESDSRRRDNVALFVGSRARIAMIINSPR